VSKPRISNCIANYFDPSEEVTETTSARASLVVVMIVTTLLITPLLLRSSGGWLVKTATGASSYLGQGDVELQETDSSCGPASLRYLLRYYGVDVSESELARVAGTTKAGTSLMGLANAADEYGFDAEAWQLDWTRPYELRTPAIVHLPDRQHFVVVKQITEDQVIVADPAIGLLSFSHSEFTRVWRGITLYISARN